MAGMGTSKRKRSEHAPLKAVLKKRRIRRKDYHSDDSDVAEQATKTPRPKQPIKEASDGDSDSDIHNVATDDGAPSDQEESGSSDDVEDKSSLEDDAGPPETGRKLKRKDPSVFATSMAKILGSKLSSTRRTDPVLARSTAAREAAHAAVETVLDSKARRRLREQKRLAQEKGRVRDVLTGTVAGSETEAVAAATAEAERRLRKVAVRGVVKLFNAVRAAQVRAIEAERETKRDHVLGVNRRSEKVQQMTKKGFLDLIASGGSRNKKDDLDDL